jgi:murein hydrolase activator
MLKLMAACFLALVIAIALPAQQPAGSEDLKQKQAEIQREIDELKNTLKDSKHLTTDGIRQLEMVKQKLRLRQQAISNINHQMKLLEGNIGKSKSEIDSLKDRLDTLKAQYARNIVYTYKLRSNNEYLSFIFSASSFNDALRRIHYFRTYHQYCEDQTVLIKNTQLLLAGKINGLEMTRKEKDAIIQKQEKQKQELEEEKKEKNAVVKTLKSREKELTKELTAKKKADQKLGLAIQSAMAKTTKEEKKIVFRTTPEGIRISGSFKINKGRLPWPVDKTQIKLHFGPNRIPEVDVIINNPGLTLETEPGAAVKAIFEGDVTSVFSIEDNWSVMVRHGEYFTVYSNLKSLSVSKNQKVTAGQVLGTAATNDDGNGEIDFIMMQEKTKMDPEKWIRKR